MTKNNIEECLHLQEARYKIYHLEPMTLEEIKCYRCRNGYPKEGCLAYVNQKHIDDFNETFKDYI